MNTQERLQSLDALRGFDMFFIMGLEGLIVAICGLFPGGDSCWLATQMTHVEWEGLRFYDTIFPLFLFLAGVSFPFSYAKSQSKGFSRGKIYKKIIIRGLVLFLLGMICGGLLKLNWANQRIFSVLGRIGLAWMAAALIYINTKPRARIIISTAILIGYWLLLKIPAPDFPGASPLSMEGNIAGFVDRTLFGQNHLQDKIFENQGLLITLPAIVTALLGMFAGEIVRKDSLSGKKKTGIMLGIAAGMLVLGLVWSLDFPLIKKLWTSSYVLVVGAYSFAMFALFYYIIDVKGHKGWILPFTVVGMNSITIYMAQRIISFSSITKFFLGGAAGLLPAAWGEVLLKAGYIALCWLFLYFLYKKKVFLKV